MPRIQCREDRRLLGSTPLTVSVANHSTMIGPNQAPTLPVPKRCTANRPIRIAADVGTTKGLSAGVITSSPSIAPSTEIAGVSTLSP